MHEYPPPTPSSPTPRDADAASSATARAGVGQRWTPPGLGGTSDPGRAADGLPGWQPDPEPPRRRGAWWWTFVVVIGGGGLLGLLAIGAAVAVGVVDEFGSWEDWDDWDEAWGWEGAPITVGPDGDLAGFDLPVGACAAADDAYSPTSLRAVSCQQAHVFEVYSLATLDVADGLTIAEAAADVCEPAFGVYVGAAYTRSNYDYAAFVPDATRFDAGERHVACAVRPWDGSDIVGSVANTRR